MDKKPVLLKYYTAYVYSDNENVIEKINKIKELLEEPTDSRAIIKIIKEFDTTKLVKKLEELKKAKAKVKQLEIK